jgi:two-component system cell cycle sensor histidine kinase/response regulator CckA
MALKNMKKRRLINFASMKFKIISVLTAASIMVLLLQLLHIAPTMKKTNIEKLIKAQEELADQIAENIDFTMQQATLEIEEIANLPSLTSMNKDQVDKTIAELNVIAQFYNYYFVLDSEGNWFSYPTRPDLAGQSIPARNRGWVDETVRRKDTIFIDAVLSSVSTLVTGFSTPIISDGGETVGILCGVVVVSEENTLLASIANIQIGANGYAYVVSQNGCLLAHPSVRLEPDRFPEYTMLEYAPVKKVVEGESGIVEYTYDDKSWLAAYRPIHTTGWGVIVQQPKSDILRAANETILYITLLSSMSFVACAVVLALLIHHSLKPLTELLRKIKSGYDDPAARYKNDEIGQLAREFNELYLNLHESEASYRESSDRFRQMADNIDEAFWMEDLVNRKTIYVNSAFERIFGVPSSQVADDSRKWMQVIHPDDLEQIETRVRGGLREDEEFVYRIIPRDGTVRWIQSRVFIIRNESGEAARLVGIAEEITERKKIEDALKKSEEQYRALFENSPIPILLVDLSEVKKYIESLKASGLTDMSGYFLDHVEETKKCLMLVRIIEVNRAALTLYRVQDPEGFHFRIGDNLNRESLEVIDQGFLAISEGRESFASDAVHTTLNGETLNVVMSCRVVPGYKESMSMVLVSLMNITDRMQLEEELRQSQKMEAIGRLAGGIAHDFNNILTAIIGYSDILQNNRTLDRQTKHQISEIRKAADRAASLTQKLLVFSRKQIMQSTVIDPNRLIREIKKMLKMAIGEQITLETRLAHDIGRVKADPVQIEQVIINLSLNARDAMPEGGMITIETRNETLDEEYCKGNPWLKPGSYVVLTVRDTGHGMDAETQCNIFEPFFTTKQIGKGTGLGLATVFGIVKQSNGYIEVKSEVNRGTTFNIYLPQMKEAYEVTEKRAEDKTIKKGVETILVVEDEKSVRNFLGNVLRKHGYTVLEAGDASEAIRVAQQCELKTVSLMISDVVMPDVDGVQLADEMLRKQPTMRVLFISGYTQNALTSTRMQEMGAAFLQKPFTAAELEKKIREILDGAMTPATLHSSNNRRG